jgi:predicted nucleic acid-binding protein
MKKQIFMDTAFLLAVVDDSDKYHEITKESYKQLIMGKWSIVTTEAILIEFGNGLSTIKWRQVAHKWLTRIRKSHTIFTVVSATREILDKAIELYGSRLDKEWGLTDCVSFVVMQEYALTKALMADHHFEQAGYEITLTL